MNNKIKLLLWHRLNKRNSKGLAPIYARITINGERYEFSTSIFVAPSDFDTKTKQIKNNTGNINNDYYINRIKLIEVKINKFINDMITHDVDVNLENLKCLLNGGKINMLKPNKVAPNFIDFCNTFVEKKIFDNPQLTTKYNRYIKHIQKFIVKKYGKKDIPLSFIRLAFVDELFSYLKIEKKHAYETSKKYISFVKRILDYAVLNEYLENNVIKTYVCDSYGKRKEILFLSEDDLLKIYKHKFDNLSMERVKNLFLFQCFTGLAYGDMSHLTQSNIRFDKGKYWIIKERQKTGITSNIPLLPEAIAVLEKIRFDELTPNDYMIDCLSNQRYNKLLKVLSVEVGVEILLTSHIARKTFATIILNKGQVSIETVSKMLGHANTKITQSTYTRVLNTKIDNEMKDFSFLSNVNAPSLLSY